MFIIGSFFLQIITFGKYFIVILEKVFFLSVGQIFGIFLSEENKFLEDKNNVHSCLVYDGKKSIFVECQSNNNEGINNLNRESFADVSSGNQLHVEDDYTENDCYHAFSMKDVPNWRNNSYHEISPQHVRYSQDEIFYKFQAKKHHKMKEINVAVEQLKHGNISVTDFPHIRVTDFDDHLYTLDNRRLWVFKEYQKFKPNLKIKVRKSI